MMKTTDTSTTVLTILASLCLSFDLPSTLSLWSPEVDVSPGAVPALRNFDAFPKLIERIITQIMTTIKDPQNAMLLTALSTDHRIPVIWAIELFVVGLCT